MDWEHSLERAHEEHKQVAPHLELHAVTKKFNDLVVVEDLSLDIQAGEIFVLLGPSGCGKSTTLQLINRLLNIDGGGISLEGVDIADIDPVQLRRRIGYVIQQIGLFPHKTVADNVGTVCKLLGWSKDRINARVTEMLTLVDLDPTTYAGRYPHELSGGQQQRVGVARALASAPATLLMDEPFAALDPIVRRQLQKEFRDWVRKLGTTVVFVTHDVDEAVLLADRIAVLGDRCHIEQLGTPIEVLARPASAPVADFLGEDRVLRALVVIPVTHAMQSVTGEGPELINTATAHDALTLMLRDGATSVTITDQSGEPIGSVTWPSLIDAALVVQEEKV
jgi:osmoprotectant transport system ATP-binding protein